MYHRHEYWSLLLLLISTNFMRQVESTSNAITPSVSCNAKGFVPMFTYTNPQEWDGTVDVRIGAVNGSGDPNCTAQGTFTSSNTTGLILGLDDFGSRTDQISYSNGSPPVIACAGSMVHYNDSSDPTNVVEKLKYETNAWVIITRSYRNKVTRKTQYPYKIICDLVRAVKKKTTNGFKVKTHLVNATSSMDMKSDITFETELNFYTDSNYSTKATGLLQPENDGVNSKLYMAVTKKTSDDDLFKFTVEQCYATAGENYTTDTKKDIFFNQQCHADSTVSFQSTFSAPTDQKFKLEILSFAFPSASSDEIFFHCKLKICLASVGTDVCNQKSYEDCGGANPNAINNPNVPGSNTFERRRRAIERGVVEQQTITAPQRVLLNDAQVMAPSCPPGSVYDRLLEECSTKNLLQVRNIYLSQEIWNPEYANASSNAFKTLAAEKEYQLYTLLRITGKHTIIRGIKVIRARPGSVIMDALIKYSESTSAEDAFTEFQSALRTQPSVTRVMKYLEIPSVKNVEYVPVMADENSDIEKLTLIVVVVLLAAVLFVSGMTFFKLRRGREPFKSDAVVVSYSNKAVDA